MQWTVDCNHIALGQHLLQSVHPSATDFLLDLRLEWLVIEIQQFLAVERLQSPQDTLANATYGNSPNNFTLQIELVLGSVCNVPISSLDLLMRRNEVADKDQNSHNNVLGNRNHVGACNFRNSDATVGLVGGIEVNMVRANAGSYGELQFLSLCKTLGSKITRVEADTIVLVR